MAKSKIPKNKKRKKSPDPRWLRYQKLAAAIYAQLEPYATVTHDDKIMGLETGNERQIDVSIRYKIAGHEILIIIQAKNFIRRVDVTKVGEFLSVIQDVRASKGIMICNAGYSSGAKQWAKNRNIDLCSLHDAQSADWPLKLKLPFVWVENSARIDISVVLVPDVTVTEDTIFDIRHVILSADFGQTTTNLYQDFIKNWNDARIDLSPGPHDYPVDVTNMRVKMGSFWVPVGSIELRYAVEHSGWLGEIGLSECRGIVNQLEGKITASARMKLTDIPISRDPAWPRVSDDALKSHKGLSIHSWQISPDNGKVEYIGFEISKIS